MPPVVDRFELGLIGTNCYVVRADRAAKEAVVVDPSGDAASIQAELAQVDATCAAILVTHSHWDHILGLADLAESTRVTVYGPKGEADVLERPNEYFSGLGVSLRGWKADTLLSGGETVEAAGMSFEVVAVPGHSPGHLAYYTDGALFSGDVLFAGSVGRTDLPRGDWDELLASIRALAERFPPETVVYSGHGPETTIGAEVQRNPFLADLRTS
jgi:hydroxyacylglutathione hydrolase